jgi:hypothetical protein
MNIFLLIDKTWTFLEGRRENHLNTLFHKRKNKLASISKRNKEFYIKLNHQESHYNLNNIIGGVHEEKK